MQVTPSAQISIFQLLRNGFLVVESATLANPPGAPALGRTHVVPAGATGAWIGLAGMLVQWNGIAWVAVNVPEGFVVVAQDKAVDHVDRFLRRGAAGWVSAMASATVVGVTRLATDAEAKARTADNVALTPKGAGLAIASVAEKQPIHPEITSAGSALTFSVAAGQVIVNGAGLWQHRGLNSFSTTDFSAPERTIATAASKTYHLVWDAPGTGLAVPAADYPRGRFSLIDRTAVSEIDTAYDGTYDRMLAARVITDAANALTVRPLANKARLTALATKSAVTRHSTWTGMPVLSATTDWARTPAVSVVSVNVDAETDLEALNWTSVSATRYGVTASVGGYMLNTATWSPNTFISGGITVRMEA